MELLGPVRETLIDVAKLGSGYERFSVRIIDEYIELLDIERLTLRQSPISEKITKEL